MRKKTDLFLVFMMILTVFSFCFISANEMSLHVETEWKKNVDLQTQSSDIQFLSAGTEKRGKIEHTAAVKNRGGNNSRYTPNKISADEVKTFIIGIVGIILLVGIVTFVIIKVCKRTKKKVPSSVKIRQDEIEATQPMNKAQNGASANGSVISLTGVGGYMDGRTYFISEPSTNIGRAPECAIRYPEAAEGISRVHCKIIYKNGSVFVKDKSTNGTYLQNGERLLEGKTYEMNNGDVFYLVTSKNAFRINKGV